MPGPTPHYPPEFTKEAVQLYHSSEKSIPKLAEKLGIVSESLRRWIRQHEIDTAKREGLTTEEHGELGGLLPPMSQVGSTYDHALAERFVATLRPSSSTNRAGRHIRWRKPPSSSTSRATEHQKEALRTGMPKSTGVRGGYTPRRRRRCVTETCLSFRGRSSLSHSRPR